MNLNILALMSVFLLIGLTSCTKQQAEKKPASVVAAPPLAKVEEIPAASLYRQDSVDKFVGLYNEWERLGDVTVSLTHGKDEGSFWERPSGKALSDEIAAHSELTWYYRKGLNTTEKDSLVRNEFSKFASRKHFEDYLFDPLLYAGLP